MVREGKGEKTKSKTGCLIRPLTMLSADHLPARTHEELLGRCYLCNEALDKERFCWQCQGWWGPRPPDKACPDCGIVLDNGYCATCYSQKGPTYEYQCYTSKAGIYRPIGYPEKVWSDQWGKYITIRIHLFWKCCNEDGYTAKEERDEAHRTLLLALKAVLSGDKPPEYAAQRLLEIQEKYPQGTYIRDWTPF